MKQTLVVVLCFLAIAVGSSDSDHEGRVKEKKLSDQEHFDGDEHNVGYDQDAFLGDEADDFSKLSPEESKERLALIVDKMDVNADGLVSEEEMVDWIKKAQNRYMDEEVKRQWEAHAPETAQQLQHINWDDYQQTTYGFVGKPQDVDGEQVADHERTLTRDRRRWDKADQDGDGKLSRQEFSAFLHPDEVEHMQGVVVLETMEDMDKDGDGKLSIDEYIGDMYAEGQEDGKEPEWVEHERELFKTERDTDGDGYLNTAEVHAWIMPSDYDHSAAESQHLIHEADADGDGALSRQEILDKYELFVGSQATDFGAALSRHEEL